MSVRGEDVVALARTWLGTPYRHQAARLGAGCDCLGLIRGVWADLYKTSVPATPAYSRDWSEHCGDERLWRAAEHWLVPQDGEAAPGDVLLMRMRERAAAKHLAILVNPWPRPRIIHAYSGHGVVETTLSPAWERRIVARFRFPDTLSERN